MSDSEIITQLAEALPEGTEVPGWEYDIEVGWLDATGHGPSHLDELGLVGALAAFTYAAEGVLHERFAYVRMHSHTCWYVWQYWDHPELLVADAHSRPAAALAALRRIKEAADV